ncbi:MAG: ABC transporter permease [Alicyclobacillus shizuokensis]|nr:ABC transporter permease [Alicyclobacillus shizuokensis]
MIYVLKKVGFFIFQLWAALTLNFIIPRMMPGNPAEALIARMQGRIDARTLHALEVQFGISHAPWYQQYLSYLWNMLHGQFGLSVLYYPVKVTTVIGTSMPYTLGLVGMATIFSFILGTLLGIYGAWKRNGVVDSLQSTVLTFLQAVPAFWLGLVLLYYCGFVKGWFPIDHAYDDGMTPAFNWPFLASLLRHAALPGFALFITQLGGWMLLMRNNMIQTMADDYVVFAEAKGIPNGQLMTRYVARNAILPSVTGFGMALASVVGGSILVEQVFSYPGVGYELSQAVQSQDYALMQGLFLIISVTMLVANLLVDMLYARLDPRVRAGGGA